MLQKDLIYQMPTCHKCRITKTRGWHIKCYAANNVQETQFVWKPAGWSSMLCWEMMGWQRIEMTDGKRPSKEWVNDVKDRRAQAELIGTKHKPIKNSEMCKQHQWVMSTWS